MTLSNKDNSTIFLVSPFSSSNSNKTPQAEPLFQRALHGMEKLRGVDDPATLTAANSLALLLEAWHFVDFIFFFNQGTVCHQVEKSHLSSECWCLIFAVVESPLIVNLHLVFWILGLTSKACVKPATCSFLLNAVGVQNLQNPGTAQASKKNPNLDIDMPRTRIIPAKGSTEGR